MIRRLTPQDGTAFHALCRQMEGNFSVSGPPIGNLWRGLPDKKRADLLHASENGTEQILLGVFPSEASVPVGVVGLRRELRLTTRHKASLWGLYVLPERRRQGLGSQLVSALLREAQQMTGLEMIRLVVPAANVTARNLFQRQEFQTYAVEPRAYFFDGAYYDEAFLYHPLTSQEHL